jgi:hypothetical protein
MMGASRPPSEKLAVQALSAIVRCRLLANITRMSDRVDGISAEPAMPIIIRAAISTPGEGE